jgi:hypothetical protein
MHCHASVFACETADSYDVTVLVFAVCWPRDGGGCSFSNNFYYVTCRDAQFLHRLLVNSGDSPVNVTLPCVFYS